MSKHGLSLCFLMKNKDDLNKLNHNISPKLILINNFISNFFGVWCKSFQLKKKKADLNFFPDHFKYNNELMDRPEGRGGGGNLQGW